MPNSRNDQRDQNQDMEQRQPGKSNRGFAAMNKDEQRQIARKGGEAVSRNREHMAEIGRRGGEISGANRSRTNQGSMNNTLADQSSGANKSMDNNTQG